MNQDINIVIDIDIPFIKSIFEPYCNVKYYKGADITNSNVKDADALIVRTRTKCNRELLEGTSVKFIATATIGLDHIDLDYAKEKGIVVVNAAGCNSGGVMQYVFTAIYSLAHKLSIPLSNKTLGVVGCGNVGSKVVKLAEKLGFRVLKNDPPKELLDPNGGYVNLDKLLAESDIVTLHTPLNSTTENLASYNFFQKIKDGAIFINSSRGEVVDEDALLAHRDKLTGVVIDVWRDEPNVNINLLNASDIATYHIAGYSLQGKINATVLSVRAVAEFFNIYQLTEFEIPTEIKFLDFSNKSQAEILVLLNNFYEIYRDDLKLRSNPKNFENYRSKYNYRDEFTF